MKTNDGTLRGKSALVTGSTGGIGLAIARRLAMAGCDVMLHGIETQETVQKTVEVFQQQYGVNCAYVRADLQQQAEIAGLFSQLSSFGGGPDILVNNAVVRHFYPVESFPVEAWDKALAVNLSAAFHTIRLSLPHMRARGWGRVFNMTSVYSSRGATSRIDYVTTKTALLGMTRAVALETLNQGITCNAICPGSVSTPSIDLRVQALMQEQAVDQEEAIRRFLAGKQPIERLVDSAHVAELLFFLCGEAAQDITGAMLPVEGGWLAS